MELCRYSKQVEDRSGMPSGMKMGAATQDCQEVLRFEAVVSFFEIEGTSNTTRVVFSRKSQVLLCAGEKR